MTHLSPPTPAPGARIAAPSGAAPGGVRVSVLVAAWNADATLERALRSALRQTLAVHEVLVCDDASTDGTRALTLALARQDTRVRLVAAEANGGPATARNRGIDAATGTHVTILDADDSWLPTRIEALASQAAGHDFVADNLLLHDAGISQDIRPAWDWSAERDRPGFGLHRYLAECQTQPFSWNNFKPLVALDFLRRHGLRYYDGMRAGEDYAFYAECLLAGARATRVSEPLYRYTVPVGLVSGLANPDRRTPQPWELGGTAAGRFWAERRDMLDPEARRLVRRRMAFSDGRRRLERSRVARRDGRWAEALRLALHPHAFEAWRVFRQRARGRR